MCCFGVVVNVNMMDAPRSVMHAELSLTFALVMDEVCLGKVKHDLKSYSMCLTSITNQVYFLPAYAVLTGGCVSATLRCAQQCCTSSHVCAVICCGDVAV